MNDTPDLVASTGVNDPNSPWAGLLQTAVSTTGNVLQAALTRQTPLSAATSSGAPANPATSAAAAPAKSHTLTWIILGLVVVVAGWLLLQRK